MKKSIGNIQKFLTLFLFLFQFTYAQSDTENIKLTSKPTLQQIQSGIPQEEISIVPEGTDLDIETLVESTKPNEVIFLSDEKESSQDLKLISNLSKSNVTHSYKFNTYWIKLKEFTTDTRRQKGFVFGVVRTIASTAVWVIRLSPLVDTSMDAILIGTMFNSMRFIALGVIDPEFGKLMYWSGEKFQKSIQKVFRSSKERPILKEFGKLVPSAAINLPFTYFLNVKFAEVFLTDSIWLPTLIQTAAFTFSSTIWESYFFDLQHRGIITQNQSWWLRNMKSLVIGTIWSLSFLHIPALDIAFWSSGALAIGTFVLDRPIRLAINRFLEKRKSKLICY